MSEEAYRKLRERLNDYPLSFPEFESGIEIKILKKLFTEDEAVIYVNLTLDLETADELAARTGQNPKEVEEILQRMTKKGLVFPRYPKREGEPFYYAAAPYHHGILEHQVMKMDKELAEFEDQYLTAIIGKKGPVPLRQVPVGTAVKSPASLVAPYDDVREIIRNMDRIALAPCTCRAHKRALGSTCSKPDKCCMLFDFYADYYVGTGLGQFISTDEALAKLDEFEKVGLVPQFSNSKKPEALCNCCPDCCGQLSYVRKLPSPGLIVASNYFSQVDPTLCSGCGACTDRCPMNAIIIESELAEVKRERCIGCGLCVSSCPTEALVLQKKPESEQYVPPKRCDFMRPTSEFESRLPLIDEKH